MDIEYKKRIPVWPFVATIFIPLIWVMVTYLWFNEPKAIGNAPCAPGWTKQVNDSYVTCVK